MDPIKLAQLLLTGLLVASVPLFIVWGARDTDKYRKLLTVTLFLTFDLVVFGAFTRLTDSGLGCPDWPGCYGHANPLQASAAIEVAQTAMPQGPVTHSKAWIEMIHRFLAGAVGVLIACMLLSALYRRVKLPNAPGMGWQAAGKLLALVMVQGAFGAWTVTLKLQPVIVTTHLLLGLTLLGSLAWYAASYRDHRRVAGTVRTVRWLTLGMLVLLIVQIALGGWVSTNYAALACPDFPMCHGQWVPDMDLDNGFTLWRKLGMTAHGEYLPFAALTGIHWVHRTMGLVVLIAGIVLARVLRRIEGMERAAYWLATLLVAQVSIGILTIFLAWPLLLAIAHNACAALLVCVLVMINYKAWMATGMSRAKTDSDRLS